METIKCKNCNTQMAANLDFCPQCGCYNELSEQCKTQQQQDVYNKQPQTMDDVVRTMAKDLSTIKSIMVFFTWLWGIGVVIWVIILLANL